ncbi:MAG: flagellar hook assembly protein FlgD [Alphaproteobacteria bacterium]|nr:flagellar hook assembly protein FlgD [Alphaproteobacteria bacterium]
MVTGVSNVNTTQASAANTAASALAGNFEMFLQLLTTQLKNQDPTSPMDPSEFTQQLVQFSQVEQQININRNLESMMAMLQSQQASANLNYIGKVVDFESPDVELVEGGSAFWTYNLPSGTETVEFKIVDEDGKVVRSGSMPAKDVVMGPNGRTEVAWDGTDAEGDDCDPGTYTLEITAKDSAGKVIDGANVNGRGYVQSVEVIDGVQYLIASGTKVPPEDVVGAFDPGVIPDPEDPEEEEAA